MLRLDISHGNYHGCYMGISQLTCPLHGDIRSCRGCDGSYKLGLWVREFQSEVCYIMLGSVSANHCVRRIEKLLNLEVRN